MAEHSNGNAEIQVRFLVGAPLKSRHRYGVFFFFIKKRRLRVS